MVDRDVFRPVETGLYLLSTLIEIHPDEFLFNDPTYEERRHFDLLAGTDQLRKQLADGRSVEEIMASWEPKLAEYLNEREKHLLYGDQTQ